MHLPMDIEEKVGEAAEGFTISMENVLQVGFNILRKSPGIFIIYSAVTAIVLSNPVTGLLLSGPVITGYYIVSHLTGKGRKTNLADFFRSFDKFVPLLILQLMMVLVITLGTIMLVIPGIYFAVSYIFAHFFVWFYDTEPLEALRFSRKMVGGNFGQILLLCLILAGINMLGILAFGVGILLTIPFSYCVLYAAFDDIIGIPQSL